MRGKRALGGDASPAHSGQAGAATPGSDAGCYNAHGNHQIVCVDEIKLNLLAKSCICPGFSTMVSNLVRSSNLEASSSMDTWAQEYTLGCGKEIYRAKLSPFFSGKTFSEMANLVFSHLGVCVLAVEIMDAAGVQRAVLFPAKYMIPSSSTFVFLIGWRRHCGGAGHNHRTVGQGLSLHARACRLGNGEEGESREHDGAHSCVRQHQLGARVHQDAEKQARAAAADRFAFSHRTSSGPVAAALPLPSGLCSL